MKKTYVHPYSLSVTEVLRAGASCVVIDETGNPGQSTGSKYLLSDRKSWAAVILSPAQFADAAVQLPLAIEELARICGGNEFHMTDIYRGHKSFKGVPAEQRLGAIAFLAHIFSQYRYPIIFQTLDSVGANSFSSPHFQQKLGSLDLQKHDELALWMLLLRIKDFVKENGYASPLYAVIDEGEKWKDSRSIDLTETVNEPAAFAGQKLYSRNSQGFPLIQLADFAAFAINRQQWLMTLPITKLTDFDHEFLRILSAAPLNTVNIPQVTINLNTWRPEEYELIREVDDEQKGIAPRH